MKWLLILFLGIIILPALSQTNQTDYQKLENSINGLQIKLQQLNTSVNGLQIDHQKLASTINGVQADYQKLEDTSTSLLQREHATSDSSSFRYAILTFVGSAIIAVVIAVSQTRQSKKIENMTIEVEKFVKIQNKIISDMKNVYASSFVAWVHFINFNFEFVVRLYNEYIHESDFIVREGLMRQIMDYYNRDLYNNFPKIDPKELLQTFGKEIADTVWKSRTHMTAEVWQPTDNRSMTSLVNDYVHHIKKAVALKDMFLQFCDSQMKEQDEKDREIYDKINATEEFRI